MDHKKLRVYRPAKEPVPTFFPVFTDIELYRSADANLFAAEQLSLFKKGQEDIQKTVVNTSTPDAAVVPSTFMDRGLFIHESKREEYDSAMRVAREMTGMAEQHQLRKGSNEYKQILRNFKHQYGRHFQPDYIETISHFYPVVILNFGWIVAHTVSGYVKHLPTTIRIVPPGYRRYAEIGITFMERQVLLLSVISQMGTRRGVSFFC